MNPSKFSFRKFAKNTNNVITSTSELISEVKDMLKHHTHSDYCRLCVRSCNNNQHSLYDETGQANANHELVGKYFTNAMLNMEWEKRLQYICEECWQHIWDFHQFQESIIEAQKVIHWNKEVANEVGEVVKIKSVMNTKEEQHELQITKILTTSHEDSVKPKVFTFDIKTEEPLDLNSDQEGMSLQDGQGNLRNEEMSQMISSCKDNSFLQNENDDESIEDYSSSDDMPLSSLGQSNHYSSDKKVPVTKKSVEEFDELVALWRPSLECEICHLQLSSYSQLKEHFSNNHATEGFYLMCCQLRLETRYDIDRHIRYHNAPQQLRCEACCKAFRSVKHLRIHQRGVHTSKGGHKNAIDSEKLEGKHHCCRCSKDFATEKHLDIHNQNVHKPKILECNFCEKSFMHPSALREHLIGHKAEKTHSCSFCPKAFTWRSNFCQHMRKYHTQEWKKMQDEEAQKEPKCGYRRETRGNCMVYVCIYCFKEYDSRFSMYYHAKRCQMEYEKSHSMNHRRNQCHRDDGALAEQAPTISESSETPEKVVIKEVPLEFHNVKGLSASTEDPIKTTALTFDIKTEEPLDLNSDHEFMSSQDGQDHSTDEDMSLMMPSTKENSFLQSDNETKDDYYSNDDLALSSLGQTNYCSLDKQIPATKKSVEEFDEVVALWRSSLECEICHQLMTSFSQLKEHFSKYHASEGCYLMCCQLRLETRYDIDRHIHYHNAPQQLRCEACCKAFRLVKHLRNHKRIVHTSKGVDEKAKDSEKLEGKYCCCKCSKGFATEQHLNQHNLNVHKPKNLQCNFCEKSFMHADELRQHLASHKGEKIHGCSVCPKAFTWRDDFCLHMRKSHPKEWKKMRKESQKDTLKGYRREARGECMIYVCIYCTMEYDKRISMLTHIKQCRRDGGTKETKMEFRLETRGESVVHICNFCSKEYKKRVSMQNHMRRCHRENQTREHNKGYRREVRGECIVYVCSYCSQEYEKRYSIYHHIQRCQGNDRPIELKKGYRRENRGESMAFVCIFCSKEYPKLQSIHYHLYRMHRDEASLAKQTLAISETPVPAVQQHPIRSRRTRIGQDAHDTRIIGNINELGKEGDENSLMTPIEGKVLNDDESSINTSGNKEMPQEFEETTWESEEFIKSEEEFIDI
uniref:Uncharacterized protein n=1 Tax=Stomoxys calcitrans TaxID=35570 RepID=A0A1I8QB65_STOCA